MNELTVRRAGEEEFEAVMDFYRSMTDRMKEKGMTVTWVRDVHPSPAFVKESLREKSLLVGMLGNRIVSAMVLNHRYAPQYQSAQWTLPLDEEEFFVIHALGVDPDLTGSGIGRRMVREAAEDAALRGAKALRLDVLDTNEPARKLYLRCGFVCRGEARMYYENTGWRVFQMYELLLRDHPGECPGKETETGVIDRKQ